MDEANDTHCRPEPVIVPPGTLAVDPEELRRIRAQAPRGEFHSDG